MPTRALAADDPPLARSLARIDPLEDWIDASIGELDDSLIRADAIAGRLDALRVAAETETGPNDSRTVGMMMMWRYAAIVSAAALTLAGDRRVPSLAPEAVGFRPYTHDVPTLLRLASAAFWCLSSDPDANHPDARPVDGWTDLLDTYVGQVETFIAPVIEPMVRSTNLGSKALWGIAASEALTPLVVAGDTDKDPSAGVRLAAEVTDRSAWLRAAPPTFEIVPHRGANRVARRLGVCCRAYRWTLREHGKCTVCPLRPRDEWLQVLREGWESEGSS